VRAVGTPAASAGAAWTTTTTTFFISKDFMGAPFKSTGSDDSDQNMTTVFVQKYGCQTLSMPIGAPATDRRLLTVSARGQMAFNSAASSTVADIKGLVAAGGTWAGDAAGDKTAFDALVDALNAAGFLSS